MIVTIMTTALAGTVKADTSTLNFTAACSGYGTSNDGLNWTVVSDGTESNFDSTSGIHYGTNKASVTYVTLTTTNLSTILSGKKITKVVVNARDAQSNATISVSVGSTTFTANSSNPAISNTSADFTFDGEATISSSDQVTVDVRRSELKPKAIYVKSIVITYSNAGGSSAVATTTTIDATGITNTDVYTSTAAGSLSATVKDNNNVTISGATVTWESSNEGVATIAADGTVTLVAAGTTTITANYAGVTGQYESSSNTYDLTVTDSTPFAGGDVTFVAGIDLGTTTANNSPDEVTKSVVTMSSTDAAFATEEYRFYKNSVTTISTSQGTITSIVFTGVSGKPASGFGSQTGWTTDGNNGTWTGNATSVSFTASGAQVRASQIVVTVSMSSDPIINAENTSIAYDDTYGSIAYTITNPVTGTTLTASTDAGWLTLGTVTSSAVPFTCSANESSEDRTATVTLTYGDVTKTVTVTQAHPVIDYATLPFSYDGSGATVIAGEVMGLTGSGLDSYPSGQRIKFDNTDDYLVLKFNERPGKLTFDIKGNSFSGGTFKVQTSEDGETYTDLESYTELTEVQSEEFRTLGENVRYIKWIYTEKVSGNVALGNINLAVYSTDPELEAENVEIAYDATSGSIAYEIFNPVTGGALTASTEADWLTLGAVGATVSFTCTANTAASSRTATVTLTYTYGSESITKDVTVIQAGDPNALMTIAEVRAQGTGSVHTKGIVTSVNDRTGYIQDAGAAIVVYMPYGETLDATVGDEIEVTGTLTTYNGLLEIGNPTVTILSSDNEVEPEVMTVAKVNSNSDTKQGWLVKIEASTVTAIDGQNVTITQYGNSVTVRFNSTDDIEFVEDDIISLVGNIGCFNTTQIANPRDVAVGEIEVTIGSALYTTYVTPADVEIPSDLTAYLVTDIKTSSVELTQLDKVPAGTAIVLKADAADTYRLSIADKVDDVTDNLLQPVTTAFKPATENTIYCLAKKNNVVGFYPVATSVLIPVGKAYIEKSGGSVKGFYDFEFAEDDPTAIENLNANVNLNEGAIYNLAGQRLQKMQKGINIVNGKKILK